MMYHLNNYPFGAIPSRIGLSEGERFDSQVLSFNEEANKPTFGQAIIDRILTGGGGDINQPTINFLAKALIDHSKALQVAEDQLMCFLRQDPFIPQYFGFKEGEFGNQYYHIERLSILESVIEEPGKWLYISELGEKPIRLEIPNAFVGFMVMASLGFVSFRAEIETFKRLVNEGKED
jgi:hypothetical protein